MSYRGFEVVKLKGQDLWGVLLDHEHQIYSGTYRQCEDWLDTQENLTRNSRIVRRDEQGQAVPRLPTAATQPAAPPQASPQPTSRARQILSGIGNFLRAEEGATTAVEAVLLALMLPVAWYAVSTMTELIVAKAADNTQTQLVQTRQQGPLFSSQAQYATSSRFARDDWSEIDLVCAAAQASDSEQTTPDNSRE